VISSESASYAYKVLHGRDIESIGEVTDDYLNNYASKKTTHLTDYVIPGDSLRKGEYMVTICATDNFGREYKNKAPIIVCVAAVLIILFTSVAFLLYDYLVKRESLESQHLLEAKRVHVRFVSHEIRTPINTISMGMSLIKDTLMKLLHDSEFRANKLYNDVTQSLEVIEDVSLSCDTAVSVLNDLINYDKIENQLMKIECKLVPVCSIIQKTLRPLVIQARTKNVPLEVKFNEEALSDYECLLFWDDFVKLGEIFRNVISNALKFSPEGSPVEVIGEEIMIHIYMYQCIKRLSIGFLVTWNYITECQHDNNVPAENYGSVSIVVIDLGPGMDESELSLLFQEGVQFNPNQLQAGQGSGLGLWITKGLVILHHGKIEAYSDGHGKGSTFVVELPVFKGPLLGETFKPSIPLTEFSKTVDLSGNWSNRTNGFGKSNSIRDEVKTEAQLRVLVVDDSAMNRKFLVRLLRKENFECEEAENGDECIKLIQSKTSDNMFNMILLDFEMPVLNGPQTAKRLRSLGYTCPIIGVTGNVLPDDVRVFKEHGANIVLAKPIQIDEVIRAYNDIRSITLNDVNKVFY
jgi:signal transduction histidine kinase/ActR/RegA family two-component response regulator